MLRLDVDGISEHEAQELILEALAARLRNIQARIVEIQSQMAGKQAARTPARPLVSRIQRNGAKHGPVSPKRVAKAPIKPQIAAGAAIGARVMSPEARQRIRDAQKRRWANVKREKKRAATAARLANTETVLQATAD